MSLVGCVSDRFVPPPRLESERLSAFLDDSCSVSERLLKSGAGVFSGKIVRDLTQSLARVYGTSWDMVYNSPTFCFAGYAFEDERYALLLLEASLEARGPRSTAVRVRSCKNRACSTMTLPVSASLFLSRYEMSEGDVSRVAKNVLTEMYEDVDLPRARRNLPPVRRIYKLGEGESPVWYKSRMHVVPDKEMVSAQW